MYIAFGTDNAFTEEEISHVARCFGDCMLEELKQDLRE